jgi:HK97 family phage major capsid protein
MSRMEDLHAKRLRAINADRELVDSREVWTDEDEVIHQRHMGDIKRYSEAIEAEKAAIELEDKTREARAEIEDIVRPKEVAKQEDKERSELRKFLDPKSDVRSYFVPIPTEQRVTNLIKAGTTSYINYIVPTSIWDRVQYHVNAESGVLKGNCTVINTNDTRTIYIPTLLTDAPATLIADGTIGAESNPVMSRAQLDAYKMTGFFSASDELVDDAVNIESLLADLAGRALATLVASYAATGAETTEPGGLNCTTETTTAYKTFAAKTTFTMDELWDMYLYPAAGIRTRGEWVCGDTAYSIIMKMKDDNGTYYMAPSVTAGAPDRLFGKPLHQDSWYQACTTGLVPITFGDMSAFWVRWARGMVFEKDSSYQFASFVQTYRYAVWFDSTLAIPTSIGHGLLS